MSRMDHRTPVQVMTEDLPSGKPRLLDFVFAACFALAYEQLPLYYSNQNTYFLHGLARAGEGLLASDWLANTADPFPVFSRLVEITVRYLDPVAFHVYHAAILMAYAVSLVGAARHVCRQGLSLRSNAALWASFFALHIAWPWFEPGLVDGGGRLVSGFAAQYILGSVFQPSVFGVFLLVSVYCFLLDKPRAAVVALGVAATFHSTYLLSAAILVCTYGWIGIRRGDDVYRTLRTALLALVLVLPTVAYLATTFGSAEPATHAEAQRILVHFRIPHHALITEWLGKSAILQAAVIAVGLLAARDTVVFSVIGWPTLAMVTLTVAQAVTGSETLALLFPWRASTFLVPLASTTILARGIGLAQNTLHRLVPSTTVAVGLSILLAGSLAVRGAVHLRALSRAEPAGRAVATQFLRDHVAPGMLLLIPPAEEAMRIATGAPVFVDFKSHPYKDAEVVEWFNRIQLANRVFDSGEGKRCEILAEIESRYGVTHVVSLNGQAPSCSGWSTALAQGDVTILERAARPEAISGPAGAVEPLARVPVRREGVR